MKNLIAKLVFIFIYLCVSGLLKAQVPLLSGGEFVVNKNECVSSIERERIVEKLKLNFSELKKTKTFVLNDDPIKFIWPVKPSATNTDTGVWAISGYVGHRLNFQNNMVDYNCGTKTYNSHKGLDIFTWPFGQLKQLKNEVYVIAAAAGIIIGKSDGQPDNSCSFCTNCQWNAVYIRHKNGPVSWYGHLKQNSLTTKSVGEPVEEGEYLGFVGSSGNSTGPHLHFEVYADIYASQLIDPYAGNCNTLNGNVSWWKNQREYNKPTINLLHTNFKPISIPACPGLETVNDRNVFNLSDTVYYTGYFVDQVVGNSITWRLYKPDGSLFNEHVQYFYSNLNSSYWSLYWMLPGNIEGYWTIELTYNETGQVAKHTFYRGNKPPVYSLQPGDWYDSRIWSTGVVPLESDEVFVHHHVAINDDVIIKSLRIGEKGKLIVTSQAKLKVLQ